MATYSVGGLRTSVWGIEDKHKGKSNVKRDGRVAEAGGKIMNPGS